MRRHCEQGSDEHAMLIPHVMHDAHFTGVGLNLLLTLDAPLTERHVARAARRD
ncbi:hypothetical protein CYFUS_005823 [Cystobacter fuscus]|uniref:Uncharacterized protein n=1 Tax=Cystobacter fuscus TaxID=43 RepID=A0A250J8Z4_9BACT|nr:hypothetical protein [Cystobacter fuscus]ATB40374.1 hypothetical protein CYFUS_005823 [Cystobacter fuscus]